MINFEKKKQSKIILFSETFHHFVPLLTQILDQGARARLNNIGAVDPNKLARVEGVLIQLAQQGKITQKLNEDSLKDILNQISGQGGSSGPKVKYNRRSVFDSDEDDDDDNY